LISWKPRQCAISSVTAALSTSMQLQMRRLQIAYSLRMSQIAYSLRSSMQLQMRRLQIAYSLRQNMSL
jgi:hypothetical protein